jgi:hypothetical protein
MRQTGIARERRGVRRIDERFDGGRVELLWRCDFADNAGVERIVCGATIEKVGCRPLFDHGKS